MIKPQRRGEKQVHHRIVKHIGNCRALIGIVRSLTAPPSHTTGHTGHVHGGSMKLNSYRATKLGSPKLLKYRAVSASASAGVFDRRHGPCADLLVCHASRTLTPRRRNSR